MMTDKMTSWGIGPKMLGIGIAYSIILGIFDRFFFSSLILPLSVLSARIIGAILIIIGVGIWITPALKIKRSFNLGLLLTTGIYGYIRHPIYSGIIVFIVTGIVIISRSIICLTIPIFLIFVFSKLIKEEEDYLEKKFGDNYLEYKKRVGSLLPKFTR